MASDEETKPQPPTPVEAEATTDKTSPAPPPPTLAEEEVSKTTPDAASSEPVPRSTLIAQAVRFLEESDVKNSTRGRKAAFLESKGLTRDEVDGLLPVERGVPSWQRAAAVAHSGPSEVLQAEPPMPPMLTGQPVSKEDEKARRVAEVVKSLPPRVHDRPPIVTFPEYIPPPPPPPPLFNTETLKASAYLFAGISATIYGATKYYFEPLLDQLTDSRLELSSHALEKLDEMNSKLSELAHRPLPSETHPNPPFGVVQHKYTPRYASRGVSGNPDNLSDDGFDDELDGIESIYSYSSGASSPPTRTFHVDAQTQTSPPRSHASVEDTTALPPDEKLDRIQRMLKSLKDDAEDYVAAEGGELGGNVKDLTEYLNNISYKSTYGGAGGLGGTAASNYLPAYVSVNAPGGSGSGAGGSGGAGGKGEEDEFMKVKAEIRSVKGVLLNIKNFPTSSR